MGAALSKSVSQPSSNVRATPRSFVAQSSSGSRYSERTPAPFGRVPAPAIPVRDTSDTRSNFSPSSQIHRSVTISAIHEELVLSALKRRKQFGQRLGSRKNEIRTRLQKA